MKIITSKPEDFSTYIKNVKAYRHLIITVGIRDLKSKYAQSVLGIGWAVLQPLLGLVIISFVFGYILKLDTGGYPYPVFAFTGMLAWYAFIYIMSQSGFSLIENREMIKKIYFPKIVLPFSKVFSGLIEFGIWILLLIILMFFYGIVPSWKIIFFPVFFILDILVALSIGLWLSALTFRKKDLTFLIPYLAGFGIFITPVLYPETLIPAQYDLVKFCNPLAGIVEAFRWSVLGVGNLDWRYCFGFVPVLILFITAFIYFPRIESKLPDIV